jgi:hypothetical protein
VIQNTVKAELPCDVSSWQNVALFRLVAAASEGFRELVRIDEGVGVWINIHASLV